MGGRAGKVVVYTGWPFDALEAARRQQETAAALALNTEIDVDLGGGVSMTMVVIPAGVSKLGCIGAPFTALATSDQQTKDLELATNTLARCEGDELPLRDFTLEKPLVIGKTVMTVAQFNALAPSLPDDKTSLSGAAGLPAKLPYRRTQDETAWYTGNSGDNLHEVRQKKPNAWGVHDVIGNSWAWIWRTDGYGNDTSTDDHIVASCAYFSHPLYNECRLSNRNVPGSVASPGPQAFRFVADIPLP
jgi:formylglycine-generating enzyme required for sulfatase activity